MASKVVAEALRRTREGRPVHDEAAWMGRVARNALVDDWRSRRKEHGLTVSLSRMPCRSDGADPVEEAEADEACRRLARAILLLARPFREAMLWQMAEGWSRERTLRALQQWGGVGREEARRILRVAHGMLRLVLAGVDPRKRWPRRYRSFLHNPCWTLPLPVGISVKV